MSFPLPVPSEHISAGGIKVWMKPLEKIPQQYRERRGYLGDDEDGRYEIVFRYNQLFEASSEIGRTAWTRTL